MIQALSYKKRSDFVIAFACIVLGITVMFMLRNYGNYTRDEIYQTLCVRRYSESPLGLLSYWLGYQWCRIFGLRFVALRLLASLFEVISISIATIFLYRRTGNLKLSGGMFLLASLIASVGGINVYNWDTGLYPFAIFALCVMLSLISRITVPKLIALGSLCAMITLARTPSGIFLPIAMILLWLDMRHRYSKRDIIRCQCIILTAWVLTFVILTLLIAGGPHEYFHQFAIGNVVSGHSPIQDYERLLWRVSDIANTIPLMAGMAIGSMAYALILPKIKCLFIRCLLLLPFVLFYVCIAYWLVRMGPTIEFMLGIDTPFGAVLLLSPSVYALFHDKFKISRPHALQLWACAWIVFCIAFGSDGYTQRMACSFLLPAFVAILWNLKAAKLRIFLKYFISVALILFIPVVTVHYFMLWRAFKDKPTPPKELYPLTGLKCDVPDRDLVEKSEKAVEFLRRQGVPYVFLGDNMFMELIYGPDEGFSFHNFHYISGAPDHFAIFKNSFIDRTDAVVFNPKNPYYGYSLIMEDLKKEGFTDTLRMNESIIVFRSPRKNPHKKYPIYTSDGISTE